MKHFLNDYMKEKRNLPEAQLEEMGKVFIRTVDFVKESLGDRPFRPDRSLNTAVFDAVSSALAHRLAEKADPDAALANVAYEELLKNVRFIEGYIRSTAAEENVRKRMEEASVAFAGI